MRRTDPVDGGAPRVPAAGDEGRHRGAAGALPRGAEARAATSTPAFASGLARILTSPSFLFRSESDPAALPAGAAHRVTELELASRLSFFLWSSIPDDELLNLAIAGRLRAPGVLEAQVRRMIADPRADALDDRVHRPVAAAAQSGQGHAGRAAVPRLRRQRASGDAPRNRAASSPASCARTARRSTLLDADYTFVNERLARHYGIRGVYGSRFRRVPVTDPNRRGLLGPRQHPVDDVGRQLARRRCCAGSTSSRTC